MGWWSSFLDRLQRNAGSFAAACGAINVFVVLSLKDAWTAAKDSKWSTGVDTLVGLSLAAVALVVVPALVARLNKVTQGRAQASKLVRDLLCALGHSVGYPERHIRVNLMLLEGRRRKVWTETAFNMDNDTDKALEVDLYAGVGGLAARNLKPCYGDLTVTSKDGHPDWGLQPHEQTQVRQSLKSILSVPVFDPDNKGKLVATLQVDSDLPVTKNGFKKAQPRLVAEKFADAIAPLLKVGG